MTLLVTLVLISRFISVLVLLLGSLVILCRARCSMLASLHLRVGLDLVSWVLIVISYVTVVKGLARFLEDIVGPRITWWVAVSPVVLVGWLCRTSAL